MTELPIIIYCASGGLVSERESHLHNKQISSSPFNPAITGARSPWALNMEVKCPRALASSGSGVYSVRVLRWMECFSNLEPFSMS